MARLPIRFNPEATAELDEAISWYESQSPRAANDFRIQVNLAIAAMSQSPTIRALDRGGTRKYRLPKFPYQVICTEKHSTLVVIAIAHTSRKPGYWRKRLKP